MSKNIALVLLLTTLPLIFLAVFPAYAATTETFTINPPSTTQYTFYLPQNTTFNGSISSSGTIRVWVTNSSGGQIVNLGLIDQTANFGFVAARDGNYSVNFEDDLPNPVQVTFSYSTNPEIPNSDSALLPFSFLPVFLAIVAFGSILIFIIIRRKKALNNERE